MRIEVWSDVVCPFCYIGKRNLEAALAETGIDANVRWRSFELDPQAGPVIDQSLAELMATKYGFSRNRAKAFLDQQQQAAAAVGLAFDYVNIRRGNTFDAHRLIHLGESHGVAGAVKERFLRGYFTEGAAIGDPDVLARLAAEAGLDGDEVAAVLGGEAFADDVRADQHRAGEIGVTAVPHVVINGRSVISGAANVASFTAALREAGEIAGARLHSGHQIQRGAQRDALTDDKPSRRTITRRGSVVASPDPGAGSASTG